MSLFLHLISDDISFEPDIYYKHQNITCGQNDKKPYVFPSNIRPHLG